MGWVGKEESSESWGRHRASASLAHTSVGGLIEEKGVTQGVLSQSFLSEQALQRQKYSRNWGWGTLL